MMASPVLEEDERVQFDGSAARHLGVPVPVVQACARAENARIRQHNVSASLSTPFSKSLCVRRNQRDVSAAVVFSRSNPWQYFLAVGSRLRQPNREQSSNDR